MTVARVIFLDFDGVLRPLAARCDRDGWSAEAVGALNYITDVSGANIVVSSTWRNDHSFEAIVQLLRSKDVRGEIIGVTPLSHTKYDTRLIVPATTRGNEIKQWLDANKVGSFVVLDDECTVEPFNDRLVLTDSREGLKRCRAEMALKLFGCGF